MTLTIVFDVTVEVMKEQGPPPGIMSGQTPNEFLKHGGDYIFSPVRECGRNPVHLARSSDSERGGDELGHPRGQTGAVQSLVGIHANPEEMDKPKDPFPVRPALLHGLEVELEVREVAAVGHEVAFLVENNLIDQTTGFSIRGWEPGNFHTRQMALKSFQKGLKIPNAKHVALHEMPKLSLAPNLLIEGMAYERVDEVVNAQLACGEGREFLATHSRCSHVIVHRLTDGPGCRVDRSYLGSKCLDSSLS